MNGLRPLLRFQSTRRVNHLTVLESLKFFAKECRSKAAPSRRKLKLVGGAWVAGEWVSRKMYLHIHTEVGMRVKHRTEKGTDGKAIPNPYKDRDVRRYSVIQYQINGDYEGAVVREQLKQGVKAADAGFVAGERSWGWQDVAGSPVKFYDFKAKKADEVDERRWYVWGLPEFRQKSWVTIDGVRATTEQLAELDEYIQKPSAESQKKQAERQGLTGDRPVTPNIVGCLNVRRIHGQGYRIEVKRQDMQPLIELHELTGVIPAPAPVMAPAPQTV